MAEKPPTAVLSDELKSAVASRRLVAAVFLTFRFEPDFFEQQVLPLFFDVSLSHAEAIKRVQMEDLLRDVPHGVAVYYDQNGLVADAKPARLDVRRIAVRHSTGIFHPKNFFALVETVEPDKDGRHAQTLIIASMSANLTRAGWWENVEVCHIEQVEEGELTRLKDDVFGFLEGLERRVFEKAADGHAALKAIKAFLRSTAQRQVRSSGGWLEPHFFDGSTAVVDFLREAAGRDLCSLNIEIISPYFDAGPTSTPPSTPLSDMIEQFSPREVRVFLPKTETGEALCSKEIFDWVKLQPGVSWARLPKEVTRGGKAENAKGRMVHAKVYRFFSARPKREFLFVGSVNLTGPAHRRGGNLETGFLVEIDSPRRPDWWMECDGSKPTIYDPPGEDEGAVSNSGTRLSLRYWWDSKRAKAYWDDPGTSRVLSVSWSGVALFDIDRLESRQWTDLPAITAAALEQVLRSTSILLVKGDRGEAVPVLVQEEGMKSKPSALFDLSPSEILRYWSLLTAEQRAAFLEARAPEAAIGDADANLVTRYARAAEKDTFFDRFAGIFISFGNLERHIRDSLKAGNSRPAEYRLFGQKYDSLGRLLDRVHEDNEKSRDELVEHYVMALCARQTVTELRRDFVDFFAEHADDARRLERQLAITGILRTSLAEGDDPTMADFLNWFDKWFLRRAVPVEQEADT
jgi:hypothetical protein